MLASAEAAYEDPGEQVPMGFVSSGGEFHEAKSDSHWLDYKNPSFPSPTCSDNSNWDSASMHIIVAKEAIRKAKGWVNAPLECWGCANSPRYHLYRFHTYSNYPNNIDLDMA